MRVQKIFVNRSTILDDLDKSIKLLNTCNCALETCEDPENVMDTLHFILKPLLEQIYGDVEMIDELDDDECDDPDCPMCGAHDLSYDMEEEDDDDE